MQDAHNGHDHHPTGLIRLAALAAALLAAPAAHAADARFVALPSPLIQLTASPPIGGGASAGGEGHLHRVIATIRVHVSLDATGAPVAVHATQRLEVRRIGDFAFTIGAPLTNVTTARGSSGSPGLRAGAYLWQGFNPGRRILAASITLEPRAAVGLPLRLEIADGRVRLINTTTTTVTASTADGNRTQVRNYRAALRTAAARGAPPTGGSTTVASAPGEVRLRISAPLAIDGTIGTRRIRLTLGGASAPHRAVFPAGAVHLTVRARPPLELLDPPPGESGRALFARATRASLEFARSRQYDRFLGNPDPTGPSSATYVYVTAQGAQPVAAQAAPPAPGRDWVRLLLIVAALLAAALVAAVTWARA